MYKLCIYKTLHFDNDDLDHEEFFKNEQEMYKRYRELLYGEINYLTVWKLVGDQKYSMLECCANCKNFAFLLKNNKYQDIELFCFATGYFISGIFKDKRKIKHYSPGGKILECKYERLITKQIKENREVYYAKSKN